MCPVGSLRDMIRPDSKEMEEYISKIKGSDEEEKSTKKKKTAPPKNASQIPKKPIKEKDSFVTEKKEEKIIPLSVHEEKVKKLEEKITKLETKNKELTESNKELKKKADDNAKSFRNEKKRADELDEKLVKRNADYQKVSDDLKDLKKSVKGESNDLSEKNKEIDGLKADIKKLKKENEKLTKEKDKAMEESNGLRSRIGELESELEEMRRNPVMPVKEQSGHMVSRISATELKSDLFTASRYKVNLSSDGTFMTFKADINGSGICNDNVIPLPLLSKYVPFSGTRGYTAETKEDGTVVVSLV